MRVYKAVLTPLSTSPSPIAIAFRVQASVIVTVADVPFTVVAAVSSSPNQYFRLCVFSSPAIVTVLLASTSPPSGVNVGAAGLLGSTASPYVTLIATTFSVVGVVVGASNDIENLPFSGHTAFMSFQVYSVLEVAIFCASPTTASPILRDTVAPVALVYAFTDADLIVFPANGVEAENVTFLNCLSFDAAPNWKLVVPFR